MLKAETWDSAAQVFTSSVVLLRCRVLFDGPGVEVLRFRSLGFHFTDLIGVDRREFIARGHQGSLMMFALMWIS